jgi:HPt (histidine-containing phosphotransfer) domain-containing protein
MNDHVGKPFKRDELLDAVARNLRSADPDESVSGRGREARDDGAAAADREALTALLGAEKLAMLRGKLARRLEAGFARDPASADARGALAREAHKLASSAGALGFPELSRRCAILEAALRAEIEADVAQALDAVREASASAIAEIAEPGDGRPERPALPFSRR